MKTIEQVREFLIELRVGIEDDFKVVKKMKSIDPNDKYILLETCNAEFNLIEKILTYIKWECEGKQLKKLKNLLRKNISKIEND